MNLGLSQKRYQLEIPQLVWEEFFEHFTEDNRGRPITLRIMDQQVGHFDLLRGTPLHSVIYELPDHGNDLVVAVSRELRSREVTFAHTIVYPQSITLITDDDGLVLSCIVTDDDNAQTVIHFED
jgi:hypothetical protein